MWWETRERTSKWKCSFWWNIHIRAFHKLSIKIDINSYYRGNSHSNSWWCVQQRKKLWEIWSNYKKIYGHFEKLKFINFKEKEFLKQSYHPLQILEVKIFIKFLGNCFLCRKFTEFNSKSFDLVECFNFSTFLTQVKIFTFKKFKISLKV